MQHNLLKFLFALFLLQTLRTEVSVWAQDDEMLKKDNLEETTSVPNSAESTFVVDYDEQLLTTTSLPEDCSEGCTTQSAKDCQCNCSDISLKELCDQLNNTEITDEPTTQADTEITEEANVEETTILLTADDIQTTTAENTENAEEVTLSPFNCTEIGYFPNPIDCHRYYNCNQTNEIDSLKASEQLCPTGLAFNTEFSNCMRDLSPCSPEHGGFECNQAGSFPNPNNDTNVYFRCVPHLDGQAGAYHKYVVRCGTGRIYMPQLGKCFVDISAVGSFPPFGFNPLETSDEQLVKLELKQWKIKEKAKLKEEKKKLKYEEKLQKELAKQQAKEAKEKAKAEKKNQKELGIFEFENDDE